MWIWKYFYVVVLLYFLNFFVKLFLKDKKIVVTLKPI